MSINYIDQIASQEILKQVTNLCSECYSELKVGDTIYYDMQEYRYLCKECHQQLQDIMQVECEADYYDDTIGLFG